MVVPAQGVVLSACHHTVSSGESRSSIISVVSDWIKSNHLEKNKTNLSGGRYECNWVWARAFLLFFLPNLCLVCFSFFPFSPFLLVSLRTRTPFTSALLWLLHSLLDLNWMTFNPFYNLKVKKKCHFSGKLKILEILNIFKYLGVFQQYLEKKCKKNIFLSVFWGFIANFEDFGTLGNFLGRILWTTLVPLFVDYSCSQNTSYKTTWFFRVKKCKITSITNILIKKQLSFLLIE